FVADHASGKVVRTWRAKPYRPGGFQRGWMPAHPTFYARRQVIERVGAFDTALTIAGDYDFMIRAIAAEGASTRVGLVDQVLVNMMVGGESTQGIGAYIKGNLQSLKSRRRWLGSGIVDWALFAKPLGKVAQWFAR
ncbi:MAG: glycosyltransferase, partial [Planctomycetota bacterium]